jgi:hypothetical protein
MTSTSIVITKEKKRKTCSSPLSSPLSEDEDEEGLSRLASIVIGYGIVYG